jgi:hypothetical protein
MGGDCRLLVSVSLGENLVVYCHQGNFTYYTHSLYFFRDVEGKDFLCINVACNLKIYYTVLGLMYAFSNYTFFTYSSQYLKSKTLLC